MKFSKIDSTEKYFTVLFDMSNFIAMVLYIYYNIIGITVQSASNSRPSRWYTVLKKRNMFVGNINTMSVQQIV